MKPVAASLKVKRAMDICVAAAGLIVLAPVATAVALLVRVKLGSPVLFRQERPGFLGQPFEVIKFRTMLDLYDRQGRALPDEDRMTPFGSVLRRTSLDEVPQLINVLLGDMSLVGPRPLLVDYLPLYSAEQKRRHNMPPGITGLAQISGRNGLGWEERLGLDVWYVDHWSLWLDIRILFGTLRKVIRGEGVAAEGTVTMTAFTGSAERTP